MWWQTLIDRNKRDPLFKQICESMRSKIRTGELAADTRLLSSRDLAEEIGVSRNVILSCYEQLTAEGYLYTLRGAGTYVSPGAHASFAAAPLTPTVKEWEQSVRSAADLIDFRPGLPSLADFPRKVWQRLYQEICLEVSDHSLGYSPPQGSLELRQALRDYLQRTRGVECHPDQIFVTTGATQAIALIPRLFTGSRIVVAHEDPSAHELPFFFAEAGATLMPVEADESGLCVDRLRDLPPAQLVYVTPSHQFPLGGTLPIQRRIELIRYAQETGSYIIEDDYDSEFRFEGQIVPAMRGLDGGRVFYVGTFSKTLFPGLRIGFVVVPNDLRDRFLTLKRFSDLHSSTLEQLTMASFINQGHFDRHIVRMKKKYRSRRKTLLECFTASWNGTVRTIGTQAGMHLVIEFPMVHFDRELFNRLESAGVRVYPISEQSHGQLRHANKILLGYGNLTEDEIREGVSRLLTVLKESKDRNLSNRL